MVFVADDLAAWLTGLLADAGRKKLTTWVLGTDQERALRSAATAAVQLTADELRPDDEEQAEHAALMISQVFGEPAPGAPLAAHATMLEALQAGIAGQLTVLDDASLTGTGRSSTDVLTVSASVLAESLTGHLVREIVARGTRGGPLAPLANQLNYDLTHPQRPQLTVPGRDLAVLTAPYREEPVLSDLPPVIDVVAKHLHDPGRIDAIVSLTGLRNVRPPTGRVTSRERWIGVFEAALKESPATLTLLFNNIRNALSIRSRSELEEALRKSTLSQVSRTAHSELAAPRYGPGAAYNPGFYRPFAHPFAGWITLGDIISDSNPELGDAMRALAAILQAAVEQSVAARFPEISSLLLEAGIPRWSIADVESSLLSGLLPLSPQELVQEAGEAFAELQDTGTVERTQPADAGFLAAVVHYGGHAILGRELDQDAQPPRLPVRYEDLPEDFLDHFLPSTPFRVVASLDLPSVASGRDFSIWCQKPLRRRGDNLVATEYTYIDREVNGLTNPRFQGDAVKAEYRGDIEVWEPAEFSESIDLGSPLDQYYYVYKLADPKRSGAVRKLRKIMERSGPAIQEVINSASDAAIHLGAAAATSIAPPATTLAPLTKPLARMVWGGLMSHLETALADTNMTPWSITHTILYHPAFPVGPLSMFILLSPSAPTAKLHRIRRNDNDPDVSEMESGYDEKKRAYQRGRGMMGLTRPPTVSCPADLWPQVATNNEPAAWTEPEQDQAGFRILVPHAETGDDARYVSALRADVFEHR